MPQISFTAERLNRGKPLRLLTTGVGSRLTVQVHTLAPGVPRASLIGQDGLAGRLASALPTGSVLTPCSRALAGRWMLFGEDFNKGIAESHLGSLDLSLPLGHEEGKSVLVCLASLFRNPDLPTGLTLTCWACPLPCRTPRPTPVPLCVLHTPRLRSPAQLSTEGTHCSLNTSFLDMCLPHVCCAQMPCSASRIQ